MCRAGSGAEASIVGCRRGSRKESNQLHSRITIKLQSNKEGEKEEGKKSECTEWQFTKFIREVGGVEDEEFEDEFAVERRVGQRACAVDHP